jgi:hypothetical protein
VTANSGFTEGFSMKDLKEAKALLDVLVDASALPASKFVAAAGIA